MHCCIFTASDYELMREIQATGSTWFVWVYRAQQRPFGKSASRKHQGYILISAGGAQLRDNRAALCIVEREKKTSLGSSRARVGELEILKLLIYRISGSRANLQT